MREYKFRGKRTNDEEWVYGHLFYGKNEQGQEEAFIVSNNYNCYGGMIDLDTCSSWKVDPNTVGQYTGLHDRNGKEIYKGDIIKDAWGIFMVVKYINTGFYLCRKNINGEYSKVSNWRNLNTKEIVGTIYDNPELLKEE